MKTPTGELVMPRHRPLRILGVVALFAALLATAPPADAVVTLTVTPDSGLYDGTTVAVVATNDLSPFATGAVCDVAADLTSVASAASSCGQPRFFTNSTDAAYSFEIQRWVTPVFGTDAFDCATRGCMYVYGTSNTADGAVTDVATVPLTFAPGPLVRPSPATGLADGQEIDISILGLTTETEAQFVQCVPQPPVAPPAPPGPCLDIGASIPNPTGAAVPRTVNRYLPDGLGGEVDCESAECWLGVRVTGGPAEGTHGAPIDFTDQVFVSVTPFDGLVRDDVVDLEAVNVPRDDFGTTARLCRVDLERNPQEPDEVCNVGDALVDATDAGRYSSTLTIERLMTDGSGHDCGDVPHRPCWVTFFGRTGPAPDAPLAWVAAHLIGYADFAEVDPRGDLVDQQPIDIVVRPAAPELVYVGQCRDRPFDLVADVRSDCQTIHDGVHDSPELMIDDFPVERFPVTNGGETLDCVIDNCSIILASAVDDVTPRRSLRRADLGFRESVTFHEPGGAVIPRMGTVGDGTEVTARAFGSPPGAAAFVMQCAFVFDPRARFVCGNVGEIESAPFDGEFEGDITILDTFVASDDTTVVCDAPTVCAIAYAVVDSAWNLLQGAGQAVNVTP